MGGAIVGDVERAGAGVKADTETARNKALSDIAAGSLSMPTGPMTSAEAEANSTKTYTGPMGIDTGTMTDLYKRSGAVQQQAQALGTNAGRATLLGKKYGQTSWGGGQLDAALAGAGGAGGRIAGAAGAYGRLLGDLGNAQTSVQQAATTAKDTTAAASKAYADAVPGLKKIEAADLAVKNLVLAEEKLRRQQQDEADAAAGGGIDRPGTNARNVASDKGSRGTTPTRGVGKGGGPTTEQERLRIARGIHTNFGGWP